MTWFDTLTSLINIITSNTHKHYSDMMSLVKRPAILTSEEHLEEL